jgi:hypothetical protein
MIDTNTGERIEVHTEGEAGPYIMVPPDQLDALGRLLNENGIGHSVDHAGIQLDGGVVEKVVNLGRDVEVDRVQEVLDSVN